MYTTELERVGLSAPEAKVYEALLINGVSSAAQVSKLTGLGRTNVYDYVSSLEKSGLVSQREIKGKIHFMAESPSLLKEMAHTKLRQAKEITNALAEVLPKLEEHYGANSSKPIINFNSGIDLYNKLYEDAIKVDNQSEVIVLTPSLNNYTAPDSKIRSRLQRTRSNLSLIVNSNDMLAEYQATDIRESRTTLLLPKDVMLLQHDYLVCADSIYWGDFYSKNGYYTQLKDAALTKVFHVIKYFLSLQNQAR